MMILSGVTPDTIYISTLNWQETCVKLFTYFFEYMRNEIILTLKLVLDVQ